MPRLTEVVQGDFVEYVVSEAKLLPILAILLCLFLLQVTRRKEGMALGFINQIQSAHDVERSSQCNPHSVDGST
jgi:hypothetical protein